MQNNESLGTLADEQDGSRKDHRAARTSPNKRITFENIRLYLLSGFYCSNNAEQCYDRIAHNVVIKALKGAPSRLNAMIATL